MNVSFTMDGSPDARVFETPLVDVNYGWGSRAQLKIEIPWILTTGPDAPTRNGLGNPLVGIKFRFLDEETAGIAVSTYPQFGFNLVSSSASRGLAERESHFLLPVSAVKNLGALELNVEVGRDFGIRTAGAWFWGVAAGRTIGRIEALAEVFGTHGDDPKTGQVLVDLGARVPLGGGRTLLASAGRSLSDADGPRHTIIYLGIQFTAGGPVRP